MNWLNGFREDLKLFTRKDALMFLGVFILALLFVSPVLGFMIVNIMTIEPIYSFVGFLFVMPFMYLICRTIWRAEVKATRRWQGIMKDWNEQNVRLGISVPKFRDD